MTALPNHTCFTVLDSYGVELPFEVIDVDIVKFNLPDADKYSRCAILVNGEYNKNLVKLANISGSWKDVACTKADALSALKTISNKAERLFQILDQLKTSSVSNDERFKLVNAHNDIIDFFANYHIDACRKLRFDIASASVQLVHD